jgi:microcystin-dependent protein
MVDDDFIGEVIGGSSFDDQIAKFMRTPQFSALLTSVMGTSSTSASSAGATSGGFPVGSVTAYSGETLPTGYLWCDGSTFEAVVYPELREVLGVKYVLASDSPGIYRVPDLRSRVPVGAGQGTSLSQRTLASRGGQEDAIVVAHSHGMDGAEGYTGYSNPRHSHTMPSSGAHRHALGVRFGADGDSSVRNGVREANAASDSAEGVRTTESSHTHPIDEQDINHRHTIASAGDSGTGKNMPPFVVLNYIIKAR